MRGFHGRIAQRNQLVGQLVETGLDLLQRRGDVRGVGLRGPALLTAKVLHIERDGGELVDRVVQRGTGTRKRWPFGHRAGISESQP